jgi:hypothetical protein
LYPSYNTSPAPAEPTGMKYTTQKALANGIMPFLWDTGDLINRQTYAVKDQQGLDALLEGAGKK